MPVSEKAVSLLVFCVPVSEKACSLSLLFCMPVSENVFSLSMFCVPLSDKVFSLLLVCFVCWYPRRHSHCCRCFVCRYPRRHSRCCWCVLFAGVREGILIVVGVCDIPVLLFSRFFGRSVFTLRRWPSCRSCS